ncbi:arginine biosynthesis bifunctional protein ArgJ [Striga asiatica]|uniref:Arginine biosynthesis bifunctional protein ArgJ n=1 Tax=Striga asiatica TaxID=4170 RepID=A0A5A7QKH3_STRAF|nr:arginine biosynthesis bifunctional protein ArgJ [Striga asiatica]
MAETTSALCFSAFSSSLPFAKESPFSSPPTFSFASRRFPSQLDRRRSPPLGFALKASGSAHFPGDDDFGFYPWENLDAAESYVQWVSEDRVTLFTCDGLIQIGGNLVPRRVSSADKKQVKAKMSQRSLRFQESNYMDPNQSLCLGALFDIAATNGLDMGRRLCIFGFCRSIEMLCDVVEDTVLEHGGEVVTAEKATKEGLHEKLKMTVAVPLLWGVPPASETLHLAVRSGGGIVDKVYRQWDFL